MDNLKYKIEELLKYAATGTRSKTDTVLHHIYKEISQQPLLFWEDSFVGNLYKCCVLMIHYDLFDDEDIEISLAHLAFAYISRAYELESAIDESGYNNVSSIKKILKDRIMLLDMFSDYFRNSIASFYQRNPFKADNNEIQQSLKIADYMIEALKYRDLYGYEMLATDLDNDEYLIGVANCLENGQPLNKTTLNESAFLSNKLLEYIITKMEDKDLVF